MSTMTETLPIYYNTDVLGFYQKQKAEFHFDHKTDNEFLMFLLDSAVRVISIVQHLAPVIEAVSEASAEYQYDIEEGQREEADTGISCSAVMEVDHLADSVIKEHTESVKIPPPANLPELMSLSPEQLNPIIDDISQQIQELINSPQTTLASQLPNQNLQQPQLPITENPSVVPQTIPQKSETVPLTEQYITQSNNLDQVYEEVYKEEIIEIKDEPEVYEIDENSQNNNLPLLTSDCIQQLMNSVSNNEENVRIQNFVPTAMPSNLPPSFLDKSSNPLSMLGRTNNNSLSSLDGNMNISTDNMAGSSGIKTDGPKHTPGAAGTPSSQSKTKSWYYQNCPVCPRRFKAQKERNARNSLKVHINEVHLNLTPFKCPQCAQSFRRKIYLQHHAEKEHKTKLTKWQCHACGEVIEGKSKHKCTEDTDFENVKLNINEFVDLK